MVDCPRCGRPAWKPHGGMGGSIMPDDETHCLRTDARSCRTARAGFVAGLARGVEIAKEHAESTTEYIGSGDWVSGPVDWTDVDRAVRKEIGDGT